MKIGDVLERFAENVRLRLKDQPRRDYERAFRRFAVEADLASYTRRQLQGPKAKSLILRHVETIPKPSRRWVLAALKSVWIHGMSLPWPIDPKRDIGRLPRVQRRKTPPDVEVRPWVHAIRNESDPHLKLLGLFLLQFGWRPGSQIGHLKWRNVEYDSSGRPFAIVANGAEEDFKTDADIRVWLPAERGGGFRGMEEGCLRYLTGETHLELETALEQPARRDGPYRQVNSDARRRIRQEVGPTTPDSRGFPSLGGFRSPAGRIVGACIGTMDGT